MFHSLKKLCNAIAARLARGGSQMGVFQFGATAKNIISLTGDISSIEKKVNGMLHLHANLIITEFSSFVIKK